MNENDDEPDLKRRSPLNGMAIIGGILFMTVGLTDASPYLIAGAILFSGGLISYSVQGSRD